MFQECIAAFRPEHDSNFGITDDSAKTGHLLLDFELPFQLDYSEFIIQPTINIRFPNYYYGSFISPVTLTNYQGHQSHLYIIALSAVFSFVASRAAKAPKDIYKGPLEYEYETLAIFFPQKVIGTDSANIFKSEKKINEFSMELVEIIRILYKVPYDHYVKFMQAIRLINLAHNHKRDDFSLAYYLLVSAIEVVAQMAIPIERKEDPLEKEWEKLAEEHEAIKNLLEKFNDFREDSYQLTRRFRDFILDYCPKSEWNGIEPQFGDRNLGWGKHPDEKYPEDFGKSKINKIIENTYNMRSKYTHEGKTTHHKSPDTHERYFEKVWVEDKDKMVEKYLINYRLLSFIAKNSILNYMRVLVKTN
jgi:hypothetical protein